jgi:hypothetical protein
MHIINMKDRWTYKGSVTTPPCKTAVYWNVMRTIYPIKQKHLDLFKKQLARNPGLEKTGNWRVTVPTTPAHNVMIIEDTVNTNMNGDSTPTKASVTAASTNAGAAAASSSAAVAGSAGQVTYQ